VTYVAQQSVTKIISVTSMNLVTPKVGAEHELLFRKPGIGCTTNCDKYHISGNGIFGHTYAEAKYELKLMWVC
jgi:hypothetical protein